MAAALPHPARTHGVMSEAITRSQVGAMMYLLPSGPLVGAEPCGQLEAALNECQAAGHFQLILDLEQVSQIGGRAMEIMLDTSAHLGAVGGSLRFVNPTDLVRDILIAAGLADPTSLADREFGKLHTIGAQAAEASPLKFGDILLDMNLVTQEQLDAVHALQVRSNKRMGTLLVETGVLSAAGHLAALARHGPCPIHRRSFTLVRPVQSELF